MKSLLLCITLVGLPIAALAADKSPDAGFYKKAAEGGISEVEQGQLAQQKGSSQAVKDFGAMMVKDHSAANDQLKTIASAKGIDLPSSSSVGQMATKAKLEVLSGDTFDKSYITGMVKDHKEDIKDFEKEAHSGQDSDAKAFAAKTLPTLRSHLKKIQTIASSAGVSTD
jgi:putative membrane protein